jgi:hypothetical protein
MEVLCGNIIDDGFSIAMLDYRIGGIVVLTQGWM